jgi:hypothetical protein
VPALWRVITPSRANSVRCRSSIRSVISGIERRNSLVRNGPSISRHRIVPFQRPSITVKVASMGQGESSFLDAGIKPVYTDKFVSALNCGSTCSRLEIMTTTTHESLAHRFASYACVFAGLVRVS